MIRLQEFQTAAHESGFVDVRECNEGTVLWLKREIPDLATQTRERICMDSVTNSVTVLLDDQYRKARFKDVSYCLRFTGMVCISILT